MKLAFSRQIFEKKKAQILNCIKIRPLGAEMFHAVRQREKDRRTDGRSDRHEENNNRFSQCCERTQKQLRMFRCIVLCKKRFLYTTNLRSFGLSASKCSYLKTCFKLRSTKCGVRKQTPIAVCSRLSHISGR